MEILQSCMKLSIYDLEENFVQIHLPEWQFYLPYAIGQWDMSSSVSLKSEMVACSGCQIEAT